MMMDPETKKQREDVCPGKKLELATVQAELAKVQGPEYWRSLEELAGSSEFREMMHREFPKGASEWVDAVSRRGFLRLMGASMALAGMTACTRQPVEPIVPYAKQPEEIIPGRPLFFATAMTLGGCAQPLLVESHMGRPTKAEGNPEHPAGLAGSDIFAQASLLDMYDPDRAQHPALLGDTRSWKAFSDAIRGPLASQKAVGGEGLRLLTPPVSSPTLADQLRALLQMFPKAKWHQYSPLHRDAVLGGAQMAFGQPVETQYRLEGADVVLSLDADFLAPTFPGALRLTRDFVARRNPDAAMNRLYVVETAPSPTGAKADHRLPLRAAEVEKFARALASALGISAGASTLSGEEAKWLATVVQELQAHHGASVVICGEHQPAAVHALAHAINERLGNAGRTVIYTETVHASPVDQTNSLRELVADMRAGKVEMLFILGGNPVYDAPADLDFASALKDSKIPVTVYHGLYENETAQLCPWFTHDAHYLEAWSDGRACDGTISVVQPLIAPLYEGRSVHELLAMMMGQGGVTGYEIVRDYWQKQNKAGDFEAAWRRALHDGFMAGTAYAPQAVTVKAANFGAAAADDSGLELNFRRDPCVLDGSLANNGWLQELPKPMSKMTWDNPAWIGPGMAQRLGLKSEDVVELELNGKKVRNAVWVQAGHADNAVTVFLGYGRRRAGRAGSGAGFDVYPLRTSDAPWRASGVKLSKTGDTYKLASTQGYQTIDTEVGAKPVMRAGSLEEYKQHPEFAQEMVEAPTPGLTLYPNVNYGKDPNFNALGYAWGMAIDQNSCVGCNACMVACVSENNIAVVGKEQVVRGRHMHWIRVDAYYQGDRANPSAYFQPVPCMQCENAPCELVCPVGATTHSTEGLNDMVYNRCIGTRYCSNNCPYKVRRFNFLLFQDFETPQLKMMRNPDVSVRSRGVMEKCTYCVQRINQARIESEKDDREIRDGEIQTACQQACPAGAIIFGNVNDKNSKVAKLKAQARNYSMLADLNTRPRTTYLAEVRNPNPELAG